MTALVDQRVAAKRAAAATPGPWTRWRRMSRHGRAIKFIQTYCPAPKGKGHSQPLRLGKFQKEWCEAALADGIDAAILTTGRGNGKSTMPAGLGVWATFDEDPDTGQPQVPVIATKITQAIKSVYGVAAAMVKGSPELDSRAVVYRGITTPRIEVPANGGEMFPMANDVDGLQGLDYSLAIFDEIGHQPIESWEALYLATGKRERSLAIGVGTFGPDRTSALDHIRQLVMDGAELDGLHFREFSVPLEADIRDPKTWLLANPAVAAGFLRQDALAKSFQRSPEGIFRIYRLNQPYEGVDSWLGQSGGAVYDALIDPYEFVAGAPTWVGVDIGLTQDSSAVSAIQRRPDGRRHAKTKLWVPATNDPVDIRDVMRYLRELHALYDLRAVAFDPRLFDYPAKVLADEDRLPMIEVPQSLERMTPICGGLYRAINERQVSVDRDPHFRTQVLNAVPKIGERGGFTLMKKKSRGRIDGCIAWALADDQAINAPPPRSPVVVHRIGRA
jgi:phage terminase large subunit-like protein